MGGGGGDKVDVIEGDTRELRGFSGDDNWVRVILEVDGDKAVLEEGEITEFRGDEIAGRLRACCGIDGGVARVSLFLERVGDNTVGEFFSFRVC